MKFFILAALLLTSSFSFAQSKLRYLVSYNPETRLQRDSNTQQIAFNSLFNIGGGVVLDRTLVKFEFSKFEQNSGNPTLSVNRQHSEYVVWLNYDIMNLGPATVFAGLGGGFLQETVKTTLNGATTTDRGNLELLAGAGGGFRAVIADHFVGSIEGRFIASQNFDPNPQAAFVLGLGYLF